MAKSKRLRGFGKFILIYTAVFSAVIIVMLVILHGFLKDYEEGRPSTAMDQILGQFTDDNIENLLDSSGISFNEFENNQVVAQYLENKIDHNEVTYKKKSGEYSEATPVYIIYAGDTSIAKVTLVEKGKNSHNFTTWKLGDLSFDGFTDDVENQQIVIKAPKSSTIQVNGVTVSDSYVTSSDETFTPCKNVSAYVTTPTMTVYTIDGMLSEAQVTAQLDGQTLNVTQNDNTYTVAYPTDDALFAEQQQNILTIAENYGKYIINRGGLSTLSSSMVGHAKEYVADIPAVWAFLYGKSYTYEFRNENITNFTKYSQDCFSCDIYYDLYVDWTSGNKTYNTSLTYTFIKTGDKWYVADFIIN